jgi:hypothetical protein
MKPKHRAQEREAEEGLFLPGPLPTSILAWARGFIYMAGLEPLADERAWIVLYVLFIIKPLLQGFLPPLVCVSIWSKFKQRFRPLHFLGLINNS